MIAGRPFNPWRLLPFWREIALTVFGAATGIWSWFKYRQAHSWPTSQGTIASVETGPARGGLIKRWAGNFTYSYVAEGEYYSGRHQICTLTEQRAEQLISGWKGRSVVVRYAPARHDVSALLKSDQPGGQLGNQ